MYFLEALSIFIMAGYFILVPIGFIIVIVAVFLAERKRKKDFEEWDRTEGEIQRRIQKQREKEIYEQLGIRYYDDTKKLD